MPPPIDNFAKEGEIKGMNVVEISHITKSFKGARAVDDISFSIGQGEIFGMVGPNGAGKTTTIRMLMDILKPDSGEISILGEAIKEETKNRIGYLPEGKGKAGQAS